MIDYNTHRIAAVLTLSTIVSLYGLLSLSTTVSETIFMFVEFALIFYVAAYVFGQLRETTQNLKTTEQ